MESILLLEPSSTQKRQALAQILRDPQTAAEGDREEITKRLRSLRTAAVKARKDLLERLQSAAKEQTARRWFFAADAAGAAAIIRRICPDTGAVAVNKSAVVTAEVAPFLRAAGTKIVEPYYDGLAETEARFTQAWQLPEVPLAASRNAFQREDDLPARRRQSLREKGARNLAAVIGVNALAAQDGSAVLLQHRTNIRRMLTECRRIILVAGIDKIVPTPEDAVFQASCMAWFGTAALALDLGRKANKAPALDDYPFTIPPGGALEKITVILLDNGRSGIATGAYGALLQCIGCRACVASCPAGEYFGAPRPSPRELLLADLQNAAAPLAHCLQCECCRSACPLSLDLPGMILDRRHRRARSFPALSDRLLANAEIVERLGSRLAPLANLFLQNELVKKISEAAGGIDRRRTLPFFAAKPFADIYRDFRSRSGK
ncbi:MAG: LUD domain-containing protein [Smithellaceae bacterium]|nr:LUD domain-containing protein [Syntrophaceae bacterium]MDD4240548.1 LUD domain-containing protein [Smithellaceae bacterium]NLX51922.1 LUD domain-containing protein [Deltaproteobacteria bacterium]